MRNDAPILVVDDDAKIVRLVRTYLEREGFTVVEARDGRAALATIELRRPRLVVLDVMLPELDGLEVLAALRRNDDTPVIILSARGLVADRIAGLELGADDYLPKPFSLAELVVRVRRILSRGGSSGPGADPSAARAPLRHNGLQVDRDRHEVTVAGRSVTLTAVEFRLLTTLLEAGGRVLSRDQLLDSVYGEDESGILDRTIDVHIGRLRDKLGDDADRPLYVSTVRGAGYRSAPLQEEVGS